MSDIKFKFKVIGIIPMCTMSSEQLCKPFEELKELNPQYRNKHWRLLK